jgi:hypothetical protein
MQKSLEPAGRRVASYHAADLNGFAKGPQISRNISSPTRIERLALDFDNGNWSFRRDSGDFSPDEFVQHHIPDDQQPPLARLIKKVLYSFDFHLMMPALLTGLRSQREA